MCSNMRLRMGRAVRFNSRDPEVVKLGQDCYIVRDANGQALAYVYFEEEPGRRAAAHL
jgi:hypothetical protein